MVAGDWHGSGTWAQKAIQYARKAGCDTIVHVGDFGYWLPSRDGEKYLRFVHTNLEQCGIKLYWIDGNHENHSLIPHLGGPPPDDSNPLWAHTHKYTDRIIYRRRGERWTWHGKTWMALGGAVSVDKHMRTEFKDWWPGEVQNMGQLEYAMRPGNVDVMVTHDCPDQVDIPGIHAEEKLDAAHSLWPADVLRESHAHRRGLGMVVDEVKPKVLFHGHFHVRYDAFRRTAHANTHIVGLDCDGARGKEVDGRWDSDNWVIVDPAAG